MNILIFSDDNFLINTLKQNAQNRVDNYNNSLEQLINNYEIIIFDSLEKDTLEQYLIKINLNNKFVININNFHLNNISNIKLPFSIDDLFKKINNFEIYYNNNVLKCYNGLLNIENNTYTENRITIQFTSKEMDFINAIIGCKKTKEELLKQVWNQKIYDSKVIETTLYNIKQKLLQNNINIFIVYNDGFYQLLQGET